LNIKDIFASNETPKKKKKKKRSTPVPERMFEESDEEPLSDES
jgi:hypothetical protein